MRNGSTGRSRLHVEPQKTALRAALERGLNLLPDFDPYDDEAWLVDAAERAIFDAMRSNPVSLVGSREVTPGREVP